MNHKNKTRSSLYCACVLWLEKKTCLVVSASVECVSDNANVKIGNETRGELRIMDLDEKRQK